VAQLRPSQRQPSRLRALGALAVLGVVCWLAFAGTSRSAGGLGGVYIVVDGPQAGVTVHADDDGSVAFDIHAAFSAQGAIRAPTARCNQLHFRGRIEGDATGRDCWRVVRLNQSSNLLDELSDALTSEERARHVNRPKKDLREDLRRGRRHVERAFDALEKAGRAGDIPEAKVEALKEDFVEVRGIDEKAERLIEDGKQVEARHRLERAIELKHHIANALPNTALYAKPPVLKPIEAEFEPANRQTVYTERATSPDGRDLHYHWTLVEHNDPTCSNFEPNEPRQNQAVWHHADDQGCNHSLEGPRGHVGTVTVVVRDGAYKCLASYDGSQGDNGSPTGVGPDPQPCQPIGG
jgi:hypothetical protein